MKIYHRCNPDAVAEKISDRVVRDVSRSLGSIVTRRKKFVVNDAEWFIRRGHGRLTPCVMNAAKFISGTFQNTLREQCGWETNIEIAGQEIDGFVSLTGGGRRFRIPPDARFVDFYRLHCEQNAPPDIRKEFLSSWRRYVQIGINQLAEVEPAFQGFFEKSGPDAATVRVGLEFETGNIASAFRALDKLETLYVTGHIDYGVFVTSINKEHAAARIWPSSNRNGSFSELENRNYRNNRTVPLWEFGFGPDKFDRAAAYLGNAGLYEPIATGRTIVFGGVSYQVFLRGEEELLRPYPST